jgi:O-antigen biosynthesis protein WbqP
MKRIFDILISFGGLFLLALPICFIAVAVKLTSRGPILYWSDRVGQKNCIFRMPKFRTMVIDTPVLATHLLDKPDRYITPIGRGLRKLSLDELPQLFSILKGDMSLVGPRPALFNQNNLIELRTQKGVHVLVPGLTGWAQINGRDELSIAMKVDCDVYYLRNCSFRLDLQILKRTLIMIVKRDGIQH